MHDAATLFEVSHRLFVIPGEYLQDAPIQVIVLFVKYVFLVVISFFSLSLISLVIRDISSLSNVRSGFQLLVQPCELVSIQFTYVFKVFLEFILLLYAETKVVSFLFAFPNPSVLVFTAPYRSDFVSLSPMCARYHLGMQMLDTRVVHDLCQMLVIFLAYKFTKS